MVAAKTPARPGPGRARWGQEEEACPPGAGEPGALATTRAQGSFQGAGPRAAPFAGH